MKLKTATSKETILKSIVDLFYSTHHEYAENPTSEYLRGREAALLDLLKVVKIYEEED